MLTSMNALFDFAFTRREFNNTTRAIQENFRALIQDKDKAIYLNSMYDICMPFINERLFSQNAYVHILFTDK